MTRSDVPPAPSSVPVGVDPNRASIARVYDAALGGKDNYAVDREIIDKVKEVAPEVRDMAWSNRNFLTRAARFLASHVGLDQFIDCGSGLPTAENTHQVVQRVNPDAVVVYVDNDPVVHAHALALLDENENTHFSGADIYQPDAVLEDEPVRRHIDFDRPIGLFHVSTIHHYPGDDYADLMRGYIDRLPSGSYVVLSHFLDPETDELSPFARRIEQIFENSPMGSGWFRTRDQIASMAPGLEIVAPQRGVAPGITTCEEWWPDGPRVHDLNDCEKCLGCFVGRKP